MEGLKYWLLDEDILVFLFNQITVIVPEIIETQSNDDLCNEHTSG